MGFLTSLSGSWIMYLVIGIAVFGAGSLAGYKGKALLDAPVISKGVADLANSRTETARAVTALAQQQQVTAEDIAKANTLALTQANTLQAQVNALATKLAQTEKARQAASLTLLNTLKATPRAQQVTLSPSVVRYLASVRQQQSGAAAPVTP